MQEAFDRIHAHYGHPKPNQRGFHHAACPYCGAESDRHNIRFSFTQTGFHCLVCKKSGNLKALADQLNILISGDWTPPPRPVKRKELPEPGWRNHVGQLIEMYESHPDKVSRWQSYKPVTQETIERYRFGFGRLPSPANGDERLIVPVDFRGDVQALAGRILSKDPDTVKWICARGSRRIIWNADAVRPGSVVWVCENYVDAALVMQLHPEWVAVATGTCRSFNQKEIGFFATRKPARVIVAYDNDLPGQPCRSLLPKFIEDWRQKQRDKGRNADHMVPPQQSGFRLTEQLRQAGVRANAFEWNETHPPKADIGWAMMNLGVT